jgi:uncharacterized membrane protein
MELNVILLWVECVIHFATFLIVFLYNENQSRQRWGVSACAIGIAAANVGLTVLILFGVIQAGPTIAHVLLIAVFGWMLARLLRYRGNVAKFIVLRCLI